MKKALPLFLLSWLFIMFSCKEDDFEPAHHEKHETGYKRSIVSYQEMNDKLASGSGEALALFSDVANKGGDNYIQSIDSTYIIEYSNDTLTTYTMKVSTQDDENYSFSNIILKVQNGEVEKYIAHYSPSEIWQTAHDAGDYLPYEGEVALVNIYGEDFVGFAGKVTTYCTFSIEPIYDPDGCSCGGGTVIGYEWVISCNTTNDGSPNGNGGNGGPGDPGDNPPGGGGIPTDPISGNNGNGMDDSPCGALNQKRLDANFQQKINHLKGLLNSPDENGFFNYNPSEVPGQNSNQTNQYNIMSSKTGTDGLKRVRTTVSGPQVYGFMHTHPSYHPTYMGVHSTGDIEAFMQVLLNRDSYAYSLSDAYCIVVGSHGVYSLKLEDASKFYAWCAEYSGNDSVSKAKRKKYFAKMKEEYERLVVHENTRTNNERSVLKMLDQYYNELGVGIYRAVESNNSITGWQRMSLDSSRDPKFTNCN